MKQYATNMKWHKVMQNDNTTQMLQGDTFCMIYDTLQYFVMQYNTLH